MTVTFLVRRPPGGEGGGLPPEGVGVEKFVPSLESLSSLGFEERNLGCPGNFAGMSRTPVVQKVCAKKVCVHFSFPKNAIQAIAKRYGEGSEMLVFLGKSGSESLQIVKNYGGGKTVRFQVSWYC